MQKYKVEMNLQNLFRLILNNISKELVFKTKLLLRSFELKLLNFKLKL